MAASSPFLVTAAGSSPLLRTDPGRYFRDITGRGQTTTHNGLFPATPGYDEAAGIGTPRMAALITG